MKTYYKYGLFLLVLFWMVLIFTLSNQPKTDSRELSSSLTEKVLSTIEIVLPDLEVNEERLHHIIRKNAHFLAYCLLGVLVIFSINRMKLAPIRSIGLAMAVCILFAISDEVHQLFVPGRGAEVKDVLIDSAGASVGIGLYVCITRFLKTSMSSRRIGRGKV
ncbi:hypothetical protein J14TS2_18580 [Bacillus sp. J14TS2]|uniref:VanZ family protein n=1 Tax=Bacillus sp. J14TS2 TaxID=2807188 RepID=UPI001B16ED86|nr:VanZ family protein [Bacillus sp. J14TS2]GIN71383.1 hypothetical protein J14TS2_18580 [Bacillus sp. J14TS2]